MAPALRALCAVPAVTGAPALLAEEQVPPETGHPLEEIVEEQHKQGAPSGCGVLGANMQRSPWWPHSLPHASRPPLAAAAEERAKAAHPQQPQHEHPEQPRTHGSGEGHGPAGGGGAT